MYSQETHYFSAEEINQFIQIKNTNPIYCESHTKHKNTLCGQNAECWYVKARGTHSNH
jgi:hypothetical protein